MFNRLTEVEKIDLRRASADRLLWLWRNIYRHEPAHQGLTEEQGVVKMDELVAQAGESFLKNNSNPGFGMTWKF